MEDPMAPMAGAWEAQRQAAARFTQLWTELLTSAAGATPTSQAAQGLQDQVQALTKSAADYAAVTLQPFRDLVEGQREFADQMTRWAELQRDLADNMGTWASQQQAYADRLDRLLTPFTPPAGSGS
jgi:ABC-type transporter Mla subunit MlaD